MHPQKIWKPLNHINLCLLSYRDLILSIVDDVVNYIAQVAITIEYMTINHSTIENFYVPSPTQIPAEAPVTESFVPCIDLSAYVITPTNADLVQQSRLKLVVFPKV